MLTEHVLCVQEWCQPSAFIYPEQSSLLLLPTTSCIRKPFTLTRNGSDVTDVTQGYSVLMSHVCSLLHALQLRLYTSKLNRLMEQYWTK